jgi:hypothetical protein
MMSPSLPKRRKKMELRGMRLRNSTEVEVVLYDNDDADAIL